MSYHDVHDFHATLCDLADEFRQAETEPDPTRLASVGPLCHDIDRLQSFIIEYCTGLLDDGGRIPTHYALYAASGQGAKLKVGFMPKGRRWITSFKPAMCQFLQAANVAAYAYISEAIIGPLIKGRTTRIGVFIRLALRDQTVALLLTVRDQASEPVVIVLSDDTDLAANPLAANFFAEPVQDQSQPALVDLSHVLAFDDNPNGRTLH